MAVMFIKDVNGKWNRIDVGRTSSVEIHVDYGGCTGDTLHVNMDKLWLTDSDMFDVYRTECVTTNIGKVRINGEEVE